MLQRALCLLALLMAGTASLAAEDLLADLRAEVAAIKASASLKQATHAKGDGGPRYQSSNVVLTGDEVTYELVYKSFLPPNEARNRGELNDEASGLGMLQPAVFGWYSNGFVEARLVDATQICSISDVCGQVQLVQERDKVAAADLEWQLPNGTVRLRLLVMADRPELFLQVTAQPKSPPARLELDFRCYPGGFTGPFDRRAYTTLQELKHAGEELARLELDPVREPWMILADHYPGLTPRPMGPCAIIAGPEGLEVAAVEIDGNYPVEPKYRTREGVTTAIFALREFPPTTLEAARGEVAATAAEALEAGQKALAELQQ